MGYFAKIIGGGLGWAVGGPVGGIIGLAIGSLIDGAANIKDYTGTERMANTKGSFMMALLVLVAAVMRADGKVLKSELDFVKLHFRKIFGDEGATEGILLLRDILKQEVNIIEVCNQINLHVDYESKLQLLHFLYGLSNSDGKIDPKEIKIIEQVAIALQLHVNDIASIRAMFVKQTVESAYDILNISSKASDADIKKAYRKMAMKYHPDKLSYLGEDMQKQAKEKFQKVNDAYETIKKERAFV